MNLYSRHARANLGDLGPGKYAIKAITERGSERVIRYAFELARKRDKQRKVTVTCKYNMLAVADGLFLETGKRIAEEYPDIAFDHYIIDDFLCRMITNPHALDVVVMPNLYGDIMSDGSAGLIGGLGLAPSGCYGDDYAYFESAHGTAPDIAGQNIINPTATVLSAAMLLDYLGKENAAQRLRSGITSVYADPANHTVDQGGSASTSDFFKALEGAIAWAVEGCSAWTTRRGTALLGAQFLHHGIAHFELLDFPGHGHGKFLHKRTMLGTLKCVIWSAQKAFTSASLRFAPSRCCTQAQTISPYFSSGIPNTCTS